MYQEIIKNLKPRMEKVLEQLKIDLTNLKTGRATPALVENVMIEAYGTKTPLNQLAAIQAPDPRTLFIQPWDKNILKEIEKALAASPLGVNPVLDGEIFRISIPPLNEEKRKELLRILKEKVEQARIKVRQEREESWEQIKKLEKESKITEDDKFVAKDEIQKIVDEYNNKVEEIKNKKESDVMTV